MTKHIFLLSLFLSLCGTGNTLLGQSFPTLSLHGDDFAAGLLSALETSPMPGTIQTNTINIWNATTSISNTNFACFSNVGSSTAPNLPACVTVNPITGIQP